MTDLDSYTMVFKALSDPMRLRLLEMLPAGNDKRSFCVCELAEKLGLSQPCLSHHLNVLKNAGLIGYKKDCCNVYYYVDRQQLTSRLDDFKKRMQLT